MCSVLCLLWQLSYRVGNFLNPDPERKFMFPMMRKKIDPKQKISITIRTFLLLRFLISAPGRVPGGIAHSPLPFPTIARRSRAVPAVARQRGTVSHRQRGTVCHQRHVAPAPCRVWSWQPVVVTTITTTTSSITTSVMTTTLIITTRRTVMTASCHHYHPSSH